MEFYFSQSRYKRREWNHTAHVTRCAGSIHSHRGLFIPFGYFILPFLFYSCAKNTVNKNSMLLASSGRWSGGGRAASEAGGDSSPLLKGKRVSISRPLLLNRGALLH